MMHVGRLLTAAALAALLSGALYTSVQQAWVLPPLLAAEAVEDASEHPQTSHSATPQGQGHALDATRTVLTAAANIVIALGFALFLGAAMTVAAQDGWRAGLAWGIAGY